MLEQRQSHGVGELLDLHRHRGLGEKQLFGGAGETAEAHDGLEHLQLTQGDVYDDSLNGGMGSSHLLYRSVPDCDSISPDPAIRLIGIIA